MAVNDVDLITYDLAALAMENIGLTSLVFMEIRPKWDWIKQCCFPPYLCFKWLSFNTLSTWRSSQQKSLFWHYFLPE